MKDQHTKITGYRDLTQAEIDLMNCIKKVGVVLEELLQTVDAHSVDQFSKTNPGEPEYERLTAANPYRWAAIAKTDFQTGLMALTRAVAQPTSF